MTNMIDGIDGYDIYLGPYVLTFLDNSFVIKLIDGTWEEYLEKLTGCCESAIY